MRTAIERNLGEIDPYKMEMIGELVVLPKFKLPFGFIANTRIGMTINRWLTGIWIQNKVVVENELCKKCYKCTEVCPPEAMEVPEKKAYPLVNQDTCIKCYCCTERG
jgi:ferredoxin